MHYRTIQRRHTHLGAAPALERHNRKPWPTDEHGVVGGLLTLPRSKAVGHLAAVPDSHWISPELRDVVVAERQIATPIANLVRIAPPAQTVPICRASMLRRNTAVSAEHGDLH